MARKGPPANTRKSGNGCVGCARALVIASPSSSQGCHEFSELAGTASRTVESIGSLPIIAAALFGKPFFSGRVSNFTPF